MEGIRCQRIRQHRKYTQQKKILLYIREFPKFTECDWLKTKQYYFES